MVGDKIAGNTEAVSWVLFRDYLVPFEVASVFLLVAMIGRGRARQALAREDGLTP